jgi:regulator of protease activity HflC (stomatin/prohibitin superfamily)
MKNFLLEGVITVTTYFVPEAHIALLYENGAFVRTLAPGKHEFRTPFFSEVVRKFELVDLRDRTITLKGQEILTRDKVAIRVSLLVYFKVVDPVLALHKVASYEERIYEDVQLAARRFLANRPLEDILSDRNEISDAVREDVSATASVYGVEIIRADVKDLVFPGNLREIMNQVLEAERRAEAEIIRAKKDAESARIKAESARDQARLQMETEIERAERQAEVERARARLELELALEKARQAAEVERARAELELVLDLEQARALRENPELIQLRELKTLTHMAEAGGRFAIGLRAPRAAGMLRDGENEA